ncbi:hypothetical protein LINGRAHAP2_LOCUS11773 [Linum grandiflorum]
MDLGAAEKVLLADVEDRLLFEEDDRTWFKLFVLYTYGTLFKPVSSQTVKLDILGIFFRRDAPEFGLFKEFNWCQFLIQITQESGIGTKNYVEADVNMLTTELLTRMHVCRMRDAHGTFVFLARIPDTYARSYLAAGLEDAGDEEGAPVRRLTRRSSRASRGRLVDDLVDKDARGKGPEKDARGKGLEKDARGKGPEKDARGKGPEIIGGNERVGGDRYRGGPSWIPRHRLVIDHLTVDEVLESLEWYDDNIPAVEAWLAKLRFEREQLQDQLDGARHFEGTQTDVRDEVFEDADNPDIGGFEDIANIAHDAVVGSMEREEEEGREADERVEFISEERAPEVEFICEGTAPVVVPEVEFICEQTAPVVVPEVEFICEKTAPVVVPELSVDVVAGGMETGSEKGGESVEEEGREEDTRGVILEEETVHPDEPQAPEVRVEEAVAVGAGQIIREGDVPHLPEVRAEETVALGAGQNIHEGDVPCSIGEDVTAGAGLILGLRVDPVQGEEAINVPASEEVAQEGNNEMLQGGEEDVTVQEVVTAEEVVAGEEVITGEEGAVGEDPVAEEPAGQVDKGAKLKRRQVDVAPELESRPKRTKKSSALVSSPYVVTHPKITIKHSKRDKERVEKTVEEKAPGRGDKSTTNVAIKKGVQKKVVEKKTGKKQSVWKTAKELGRMPDEFIEQDVAGPATQDFITAAMAAEDSMKDVFADPAEAGKIVQYMWRDDMDSDELLYRPGGQTCQLRREDFWTCAIGAELNNDFVDAVCDFLNRVTAGDKNMDRWCFSCGITEMFKNGGAEVVEDVISSAVDHALINDFTQDVCWDNCDLDVARILMKYAAVVVPLLRKGLEDFDWSTIRWTKPRGVKQPDDVSCGVFAINFLQHWTGEVTKEMMSWAEAEVLDGRRAEVCLRLITSNVNTLRQDVVQKARDAYDPDIDQPPITSQSQICGSKE